MHVGRRTPLGRDLLRQQRLAEATAESRAGYDILVGQADPHMPFLVKALQDLVAEHDSLGQRPLAARFRAELADTLKAVARR